MKCLSIIKPLTTAVTAVNGIDLGEAKYVHCGNTYSGEGNATRFIVIRDGATDAVISTTMLGGNESIIIEKERTDVIHGSTGKNGAKVADNNLIFTKVSINGQA